MATNEPVGMNDTTMMQSENGDNPLLIDAKLVLHFDANAVEHNEKPYACVVVDAAGEKITKNVELSVSSKY